MERQRTHHRNASRASAPTAGVRPLASRAPGRRGGRRPTGRRADQRGMTLIEILVALIVVAGLFAMVLPSIQGVAGVNVKKEAGRLSGAISYLYNHSAMYGLTCRLVFALPEGEGDGGGYTAECTEGPPRLDPEVERVRDGLVEREREDEDERHLEDLTDAEQLERRVKERAQWSQFAGKSLQPVRLESGVFLSGVWTPRLDDVVTAGDAYLYFFPTGETQKAYVYLQDANENVYTLEVKPLTGAVKVHGEYLEKPRD